MSLIASPAARLIHRIIHDKFRVSLRPAVALPIAALAILASMLMFQVRFLRNALLEEKLVDRAVSGGRELLKLNVDMETGLRGYQYTGRAEFLQPYREAEQVVDPKFTALDRLLSNDPTREAQFAGIRGSFEQWKVLATVAIARRADNSIHDSDDLRYEQTHERKVLMDGIRAQYAAFDSGELLLRNQYLQDVRKGYLMGGLIFFVIVSGAGASLALSFRRHSQRSAIEKAQEDLRSSDERLRRLVWGVKDYAILMLDTEGRIITWNEGAERIKGYRAE